MADGADLNDGHSSVPSNYRQANNAQESQSTRAVRGRSRQRGNLVLAPGRPANARNPINPTRRPGGHAQAGVRPGANVEGPPRAVHALGVAHVGGVVSAPAPFGNPFVVTQAGVGVIANAIGPFVGVHNGGVAAMVAPPGPARAAQYFDVDGGLLGPPLRRNQLNLGGVAAMVAPLGPGLVQPYFDIDAGLSGPPLRRSEIGPFF